ncbi:type II toxin-antitoxin system death-on-curing family toxin [Microbispora sp. RL4-1S]|uniref:Type II toxin-antitoxin system death-on-curing family toxin n=1 Tax=Microbispora oryzae TaxID=2806554 RepID=A0A941AKC6_9ACTN|nr:type II toxin-antitoxin system death-on-curing family toxin [Microbispora oryzae]MBP2705942.1 type II toxin-antitoxin system death-on-curing family toxin [Microbispora oryzae]
MTVYLTKADLLAIAEEILPTVGLRDGGQFHAAVLRPQTTVYGEDAYPDLWTKAAALMQSVIIGHPLVDGNKRLGWASAVVFLELNGETLTGTDTDAAEALVIAVTTGELDDVHEIAKRLRDLDEPQDR